MLAVLFSRDFHKVAEIEVPGYMSEYLLPVMERQHYYARDGAVDALPSTFDVMMRRYVRKFRLPPTDEEQVEHYVTGRACAKERFAFLEDQ